MILQTNNQKERYPVIRKKPIKVIERHQPQYCQTKYQKKPTKIFARLKLPSNYQKETYQNIKRISMY